MSTPIGPGDTVECIDASPVPLFLRQPILVLGAHYCVIGIEEGADENGDVRPGLSLAGFDPIWVFNPARFRPIRKPNIEVLKSLLQPSPERELLDA